MACVELLIDIISSKKRTKHEYGGFLNANWLPKSSKFNIWFAADNSRVAAIYNTLVSYNGSLTEIAKDVDDSFSACDF